MDLNRFTEKAQEALVQAQSLARDRSHAQIEGEHLLLALLRQSDGVVPLIVQRLGLEVGLLAQQIEGELARKASVHGATAQVGLSRELEATLGRAEKIAKECHNFPRCKKNTICFLLLARWIKSVSQAGNPLWPTGLKDSLLSFPLLRPRIRMIPPARRA